MSDGPEPRNEVEEVMKIIWEGENENNTWQELIWNEYPLSDWEADRILARLRSTAEKLIKKLKN